MNGWVGQILEVNLSDGNISTQPTEPYVEGYLGGRGIGVRLVYDGLKPGTDALAPGNPLIFSMGPLTGTAMPSSGRTDVTASHQRKIQRRRPGPGEVRADEG